MSRIRVNLTIDELQVPRELTVDHGALMANLKGQLLERIRSLGVPQDWSRNIRHTSIDAGEIDSAHDDTNTEVARSVTEAVWR